MKGPAALRPRERRLLLVAAVAVGCWSIVTWVVEPLWNRTSNLGRELDAKTEKLEAFRRLLDASPDIDARHQAVAGFLAEGGEEAGQGALLGELEALSRRAGLQLDLKPRPVREDARFTRLEVELDVQGSQADLLAFLDALLAQPRLIAIQQLRIAVLPAKEQLLQARLILQHLTLR